MQKALCLMNMIAIKFSLTFGNGYGVCLTLFSFAVALVAMWTKHEYVYQREKVSKVHGQQTKSFDFERNEFIPFGSFRLCYHLLMVFCYEIPLIFYCKVYVFG